MFTFIAMDLIDECAYRGILESAFVKYGSLPAVAISALLFTLSHSDLLNDFQIMRFLELFPVGICFSVGMRVTKSLVFANVFHFTYNIVTCVVFGAEGSNGLFCTSTISGSNSQLTGNTTDGPIITISVILVITLCLIWYNNHQKQMLNTAVDLSVLVK